MDVDDGDDDNFGARGEDDLRDPPDYLIPLPEMAALIIEAKQTLRLCMKGRGGRGGQVRVMAARIILELSESIAPVITAPVVKLVDKQAAHDELMRRMRERQAKGHL